MMNSFEPIAILSAGCVLPGASDVKAYWNLLMAGKDQFSFISDNRWPLTPYYDPNFRSPDSTYSHRAALINDTFFLDPKVPLPRTHQMFLKALKEALIPFETNLFSESKTGTILGCMNPGDESSKSLLKSHINSTKQKLTQINWSNNLSIEDVLSYWESFLSSASLDPKIHYPSSIAKLANDYLRVEGLAFCVDSACASSMTAIDVSCQLLHQRKLDFAISGGIEGNLSLETFIPFSHLGVLSRNHCLPFDSRSDGIIQGEGAVVFVLERLEDAIKAAHPILGVIENITSSSNGSNASLFSPSFEHQSVIYKKMNEALNEYSPDFIEGHGTGTPVGDLAELTALLHSFEATAKPIYLGSVKSLIGHTKGTAGAAGILKALLTIQNRTIPPSSYFEKSVNGSQLLPLIINTEPVQLPKDATPIKTRINSSGFGGSNYHLSLKEALLDEMVPSYKPKKTPQPICLVAYSCVPFSSEKFTELRPNYKIPPNILAKLNPSQTLGLLAITEALERSLIELTLFDSSRIGVISASITRTTKIEALTEAIYLKELEPFFSKSLPEDLAKFQGLRSSLTAFDESSCQSINSMTSGRLTHELNLHGVNFHVDADFNSKEHAFLVAQLFLQNENWDLAVILATEESPLADSIQMIRSEMSCYLFALESFAIKNALPVLGALTLQQKQP